MAYLEIPIDPTNEAFIQEVPLDGVTYRMEFRWNVRESAWYMTLRDLEDAPILGGIKMTGGASLLRYAIDSGPPGAMFLVDPTGDYVTPGRLELGTKARLIYIDEESAVTPTTGTVTELGGFSVHAEMRIATAAAAALTTSWSKWAGTWEAGLLSNFDFDVTNARLIYRGSADRTFLVTVAGAVKAGAAKDVSVGISLNGADPADEQATTVTAYEGSSASALAGVTVSNIVTLKPNQYLEVWGKVSSATSDETLQHAVLSVIG